MKRSVNPLESRKHPAPYFIENGAFCIENGPLSFNRSLYGAVETSSRGRLKAAGGDKPEFMFYLKRRLGYLFFGICQGERTVPATAFSHCRMQFQNGSIHYMLKDERYGHLETVFSTDRQRLGASLDITAWELTEGWKLCAFFAGMDGERDSREMDAGYTRAERTAFSPSLCREDRLELAEAGVLISHDQVPYPARLSAEGEASPRIVDADAYLSGEIRPGRDMAMVSRKGNRLLVHVTFETEQVSSPADEGKMKKMGAHTPSPLIDAAMDAVRYAVNGAWVEPFFLHGAWSWGVPLLGWRSRYGSTCLGWHNRVKTEGYTYYSMQQRPNRQARTQDRAALYGAYFSNPSDRQASFDNQRPDPDPAWRLARQSQKSVFNSAGVMPYTPGKEGVVQYDMQEVFMDQMLYQCRFERDEAFYRETLEALKHHIDWQKRCFDSEGEHLYENFANFWASDGVFQSGAKGSIATAYNYRACRMAAELCRCLGEDGSPYEQMAEQIRKAFLERLWLAGRGHMAECADIYGERLVHPSPSLPTVVHCAESGLLDQKQLYQALRYTKTFLEREQVEGGELVWNTQWAPYRWSVRDVDFADVFHCALSYFLAGDGEEGMKLLSGGLTQSCLRNVAPGGFMCVREGKSIDFSDTSSMAARTIIEGLFGVRPQRHLGYVAIAPAFLESWNQARLNVCGLSLDFSREGKDETWEVCLEKPETVYWELPMLWERAEAVLLNGSPAEYEIRPGVNGCRILVKAEKAGRGVLRIQYSGERLCSAPISLEWEEDGENISSIPLNGCEFLGTDDPQEVISDCSLEAGVLRITGKDVAGDHTFFLRLRQGEAEYWRAVNLSVRRLPREEPASCGSYKALDLRPLMTGRIGDLFRRVYLSPRPETCSLQVPDSLYPPDWCVVRSDAEQMNDSLLSQKVKDGIFEAFGIPFAQSGDAEAPNAVLLSRWEQDASEITLPVGEEAGQICLLLACYTNQMQCHVPNVEITLKYAAEDEVVSLQAPDQIRPFYVGPESERECDRTCYGDVPVQRVRIGDKNESEGIYAQVWRRDLRAQRLEAVKIRAVANDVVIGVMGMTLGYR